MRVLHLMTDDAPSEVQAYAVSTMLGLCAQSVDLCAVLPPNSPYIPELMRAGIRVETGVLSSLWRFRQRRRMKALLAAEKPELVHGWRREAAALLPAEGTGCPSLGWGGDCDALKHYAVCSHFISATETGLARLIRDGAPPEKAVMIPAFPEGRDQSPVERSAMTTQAGAFVILSFLTTQQKEMIGRLVQAIKAFPDAVLWLVGDESLRAETEKQSTKSKVQERVRFLGHRKDREALLRAADVCVSFLVSRPLNVEWVEAWAAGTPLMVVQGTDEGGEEEAKRYGLWIIANSAASMAEAFKDMVSDEGLRRRLMAQGFESYSRGFMRKAALTRLIAFYEQTIAATVK